MYQFISVLFDIFIYLVTKNLKIELLLWYHMATESTFVSYAINMTTADVVNVTTTDIVKGSILAFSLIDPLGGSAAMPVITPMNNSKKI